MYNFNNLFTKIGKRMKNYKQFLNPPATEAEIASLEEKIKRPLPESFREFYKLHNGEELLMFLGLRAMTLERIDYEMSFWRGHANVCDTNYLAHEPDMIQEVVYHPAWVSFADDDGGNFLAIDFAPGPKGTVGQIINFGTDDWTMYVLAESFDHLLEIIEREIDADLLVPEELYAEDEGEYEPEYLYWKSDYDNIAISPKEPEDKGEIISLSEYWKNLFGFTRNEFYLHELSKVRRLRITT